MVGAWSITSIGRLVVIIIANIRKSKNVKPLNIISFTSSSASLKLWLFALANPISYLNENLYLMLIYKEVAK